MSSFRLSGFVESVELVLNVFGMLVFSLRASSDRQELHRNPISSESLGQLVRLLLRYQKDR